jgi:hypothetical protein
MQQPGAGGFGAPTGFGINAGYGAVSPAAGFGGNTGFGAGASGFNTPSTTVTVSTGWGGKKVVPQHDDPLI